MFIMNTVSSFYPPDLGIYSTPAAHARLYSEPLNPYFITLKQYVQLCNIYLAIMGYDFHTVKVLKSGLYLLVFIKVFLDGLLLQICYVELY